MSGGNLYLGYLNLGSGTYNLSGSGSLTALNEYVGYSGSGSFTHSGGTNSVSSGNLYLGNNGGSQRLLQP